MAGQIDNYPGQEASILAPSVRWATITPTDDAILAERPKAIHCGGNGGKIQVKNAAADTAVEFHILQGQTLMIRPRIVMSASTTATGLVALL